MKFAIRVNAGPYTHQAADSAYHFAAAALAKGHEILRVFFYHDGVNNASRLTVPPQDERHLVNRWTALGHRHNLDLVVCVAAAQRRGLLDAAESKRHAREGDNMAHGFRSGGLGQLIDACIRADRVVEFGD